MPKGIYKRKPFTQERRKNMSEARKKEWILGLRKGHPSPKYWLGKHLSEEHKRRISIALTGKRPKNLETLHQQNIGRNHGNWKGDNIGYGTVHDWIRKWKGRPKVCQKCGITCKERRIEWANIDHKYHRNLDDFIPLCWDCHVKYDVKNNLRFKSKSIS